MKIITQKLIQQALFEIKNKEIKQIIDRQRLRFNRQEISLYLLYIFKHSIGQKSFKSIYKRLKLKISYQSFMSNIALFSSLFKRLFYIFNKFNYIKASKLIKCWTLPCWRAMKTWHGPKRFAGRNGARGAVGQGGNIARLSRR